MASELGYSSVRGTRVKVSRIYDDGYLLLKGEPGPWIQSNLPHCLSVRTLELEVPEKIGGSIGELADLTYLSIRGNNSLKCVTNVLKLHSLRVLDIYYCPNLQELPQNMGDLINLTLLRLSYCEAIKSLPNSIAALSKLSTLKLKYCKALETWPEDLKVNQLKLHECCRIQSIPRVVTNLERLDIQLCTFSEKRFSNLMEAMRLRHLSISVCPIHRVSEIPPNLNEFVSLETLSIQCSVINNLPRLEGLRNLQRLCLDLSVEELPVSLDALPQLMLLDIRRCCYIKKLPSNLKNLRNLQLLNLPDEFRIETLSFDLNGSVIISVERMHIRKTWEEIKLDIGLLCIEAEVSGPLPLVVFDWVYLSFKDDLSTLTLNSCNIRLWVRFLDLKLPDNVEEIGSAIRMLPNLTHLYIQSQNLKRLPDITTRLTHLSLSVCDHEYLSDSLGKLSNLISLDLDLNFHESQLSAALDLLFCLQHLTLRFCEDYSLPHSVAKLSNLNTLELCWCDGMSLPKNLNITKLKLVCSSVKSLPTSLCHLEIVHHMECCLNCNCSNKLEKCLKQLVNPKTLSLTCYDVKLLPSIAGQQSLQTLLLKDCFNLRELMPNMGEFVELCTLNISGTRIKSLPECITKLPKLQHLVLPKCFKKKNLPHHFSGNESNVEIEFDGMDDTYYEEMGYYNSRYEIYDEDSDTSNEDNENTSVMELDDMVGRKSGEDGINSVQKSSCQLQNPPEAIQGLEAVGDTHIRKFSTGENNLHASSCSQNQVKENLSLGVHSIAVGEDMITELRSDTQETYNFGEDRHVDIMNLGNEQSTIWQESTSGVGSFTHDMDNHYAVVDAQNSNNPHDAYKKGNRQKIEITREEIQSLMAERMSLQEAARKLGVSISTMENRIEELRLGKWPSSRKKTSNCSKKRKISTMLPSGGELSQANMVERLNLPGPEYANESLDVIQHNTSDQVAPECDSIDHSTPNSTTEGVGELNVSTHRHMDVRESVHECMVGTDVHTVLGNVKDCSSSSSFDIKATYKDDIVRFKWSSTACLKELKEAVAENLTIDLDSFKLKYQDEEDDWVLINTDEHLKRALSLIKNNILRLKVTDL